MVPDPVSTKLRQESKAVCFHFLLLRRRLSSPFLASYFTARPVVEQARGQGLKQGCV